MGLVMMFCRKQIQMQIQIPDAEGAEVAQKTQKRSKKMRKQNMRNEIDKAAMKSSSRSSFVFSFLRLLRNFCALCVRY
jgi:hypothetical protein